MVMVERSPYVENVGLLMKDLDQATTKLERMGTKPQTISNQELEDLTKVLNQFNSSLDSGFWEDKKLAPEGINDKIEKALRAIQFYQNAHSRSSQRNVDQQIVSLSSALTSALNTFDRNLRSLKELKIGRRVEKTGESKHS